MVVLLRSAIVSSLLCIVRAQFDNCGTSVAPLVTYGRPLSKGEYPWLVPLYQLDQGGKWEQFCGGALLSPRIVITAAHCLVIDKEVIKAENLRVGLGKLYRDFYHDEDYAIISNVSEVVVHPGYYGSLSSYALDVGLLKLSTTVQMTDYIIPLCMDLDTITNIGTGAKVYAAGWGTTENGTSTDQALAADLSYLDNRACLQQVREAYRKYVTHEKLCSLSINGSQVDKGDSGGALTFMKNGTHFIVGVVSTKIIGQTTFSIFTDLSKPEIHFWLKKKISDLNSPGFLNVQSFLKIYKTPAGSLKDFALTPVGSNQGIYVSAVDCVTGIFYYSSDHTIEHATANLTNIKTFTIIDRPTMITSMTVDWISRKLYWIQKSGNAPTGVLKDASIDTGKIESNMPTLQGNAVKLTVHPTVRKLFVLIDSKRVDSIDLDDSTHTVSLFHEAVGNQKLLNIAIDWESNELCWLSEKRSFILTIECKHILSGTIRTVLTDIPITLLSGPFAISPLYYYWADSKKIYILSKSTSRIEYFNNIHTMEGLDYHPENCPTLNPAPEVSMANQP